MNLNQQTKPLANKFVVFVWVKKVINSCETLSQNVLCVNLIYNYRRLYKDDLLFNALMDYRRAKRNSFR